MPSDAAPDNPAEVHPPALDAPATRQKRRRVLRSASWLGFGSHGLGGRRLDDDLVAVPQLAMKRLLRFEPALIKPFFLHGLPDGIERRQVSWHSFVDEDEVQSKP